MNEEQKNTILVSIGFVVITLIVLYMMITNFNRLDVYYLIGLVIFMIRFLLLKKKLSKKDEWGIKCR